MAFFDNISRRATDATAKAMQRAQDFSSITRLTSLINDDERRIEYTYMEIGKIYAEQYASLVPDGPLAERVAVINDAKERIEKYRSQIQELKGVVICPNCHAEAPRSCAFCPACGSPMPKYEPPVEQGFMRCPNCGATIRAGMNFCTSCAAPLNGQPMPGTYAAQAAPVTPAAASTEDAPTMAAAPFQSATATVAASAQHEKICSACGYRNAADMSFCEECGTRL